MTEQSQQLIWKSYWKYLQLWLGHACIFHHFWLWMVSLFLCFIVTWDLIPIQVLSIPLLMFSLKNLVKYFAFVLLRSVERDFCRSCNYCDKILDSKLDFDLNSKICGKELIKICKISSYTLRWISQLVYHINHLSPKLVKANAMLWKLCHYVNEATIKSICYAIFHPHLSYVCTAWGQNLNTKHNIKLLQKKDMAIISFTHYDAHTLPILMQIHYQFLSAMKIRKKIWQQFYFYFCGHTMTKIFKHGNYLK